MRRRLFILALALAWALPGIGPGAGAGTLTVFAAASTTEAVEAVVARYEAAHGGDVRASFAASSTLAKQIAAGAPASVYLSADTLWMDWLAARGAIVPESRIELLANDLVLVVPAGAGPPPSLAGLVDYLGARRLAIGDPAHVPAGRYARAALRHLGLWSRLRASSAFAGDARAALALVARGEAAAGIVYASDLRITDAVRAAATLPGGSHPPIRYPLALVADRATAAARDFHDFLRGPEAAGIFRDHGFRVVAAPGA